MSMSYSGQYARFSNGQGGFDSLHRHVTRALREKPYTQKTGSTPDGSTTDRASGHTGPTPGVRHSPTKGTPIEASPLGRANISSDACFVARLRSRCWCMVAAHIRGSDGSIPSTATTPRAHSSKPYTQRRRPFVASAPGQSRLLHSSVGDFFLSVSYSGQYIRFSNGQRGFDSRHRYFSRVHSSKPYTHRRKALSS